MAKSDYLMGVSLPPIAPEVLRTLNPSQLALLQESRRRAVETRQRTTIKGIGPGPAFRAEEQSTD